MKWLSQILCILLIFDSSLSYSQSILCQYDSANNSPNLGVLPDEDPLRDPAAYPRVPVRPNAPPQLARKYDIEAFGCKRQYTLAGHYMPLDSFHRQDAEKLRPIVSDIPDAINSLNAYQDNKRTLKTLGYVGTAGIVIAVAGAFLAGEIDTYEGDPHRPSPIVRYSPMFAGIGIVVGTILYGLIRLDSNEDNLADTVKYYNEAHPSQPVKLDFGG